MQPGLAPPSKVALTFDDGPDPIWTPLVLDALAEARAPATFFIIAPEARRHPYLLNRIREEGHEVGFHCTRHVRHDAMTREEIEADLESGLPALAELPSFWRTPWGVVTPATEDVAREHGLKLAGWTADTQDWRGDGPDKMLTRVEPELRTGAILLMHDGIGPGATRDGCAETVGLVRPLVSIVRSKALEPAPLGELRHPLPDRNPDYAVSTTGQDRLRRV